MPNWKPCTDGYNHDFVHPTIPCTKCGIYQSELYERKKLDKSYSPPKENKNIHSEKHAIVDQIIRQIEPEGNFGFWLGQVKKLSVSKLYQLISEVKQSEADNKAGLLVHKIKQAKNAKVPKRHNSAGYRQDG